MDKDFLDLLRDPDNKGALQYFRSGKIEYLSSPSGRKYPIKDDIVCFLDDSELTGNNARFRKLYDRFAPLYDLSTSLYARFRQGSVTARILQYLKELDVHDSDKVIEISVGTGRNLKCLNRNARYYGVDISLGMLKRCVREMRSDGRPVGLVQAEAEDLPLRESAFDVVFSAGGFNFFNDRKKAVEEMLRVAKSGTKLLISDETAKVMARFEKTLGAKSSSHGQVAIKGPADFIPDWCRDVEYKEICDGELYALTFRKP